MKIAILDTEKYDLEAQIKKIKEESDEVTLAFEYGKGDLGEELLDLITACRTMISMLDNTCMKKSAIKYFSKMNKRHFEEKIIIKGWINI